MKQERDRNSLIYKDVPPIYIPRKQNQDPTIASKIAAAFSCIVFLLIAVFIIAVNLLEVPNQTARDEDANIMAITLCEMHVRDVLKAPRTAKFPWIKKASFDGRLAILSSYVDAENSFGAMIRTNYICTVRYDGGKPMDPGNWHIEEFITE